MYTHQSPYFGALLLVFSKAKFVELSISHGMAVNLDEEDQANLLKERGAKLLEDWEKTYREDSEAMREEICSALWSSFWTIVSVAIISCIFGACTGKIDSSLPVDVPKILTFTGTALVAWAALMELGGDFPVWDGKAFPQLAHSVLFKSIFVPGVAMIMIALVL